MVRLRRKNWHHDVPGAVRAKSSAATVRPLGVGSPIPEAHLETHALQEQLEEARERARGEHGAYGKTANRQ